MRPIRQSGTLAYKLMVMNCKDTESLDEVMALWVEKPLYGKKAQILLRLPLNQWQELMHCCNWCYRHWSWHIAVFWYHSCYVKCQGVWGVLSLIIDIFFLSVSPRDLTRKSWWRPWRQAFLVSWTLILWQCNYRVRIIFRIYWMHQISKFIQYRA